ncbi:MAG: Fe2+-dependent dioxygenase [Glaciecola sp.]
MLVIDNLFDEQALININNQLDAFPWDDGKATAMGMAGAVKHNRQADPTNSSVKTLANSLLARLGNHPSFVSAALPHRIFPPCFNSYAQGETYGFHVDGAIMRIPHNNEVLRSDLSMTMFFSDANSYEGGELEISTPFGIQRVKGQAGSAILYPSSSLHQVTPVTKGVRRAAITWVQSLIPSLPMREVLYELDQSIQTLVSNPNVDRTELDRLHHVYHNLIRQHSQI